MNNQRSIAVYGASGHTAAFVIAELRRRGLPVVAVTREGSTFPAGVTARIAAVDDAAALDRAFADCAVVINCAGPFLDTAAPVVEAALRARSAYIDITAEQASTLALFERYDERARDAGVVVIPAAGFYGGMADLLATALVGSRRVDELTVAVALDRWWPTAGTRKTGERNRVPRVVVENGELVPMAIPGRKREWTFSEPHGVQAMDELGFSEIITVSRHLDVGNMRAYINASSLNDIRTASTPAPAAVDGLGRSAQQFAMEVLAIGADGQRRARASGQDIYAVTAPLVVEAAERVLHPSFDRAGTLALGDAFDATDFLRALAPEHLSFELEER